jgi:outer membrane receptor protein involved in Fe transport
LPKFALNYSLSPTVRFYTSASRGYKSGGFNIQMLSDLAQNDLKANMVDSLKSSIIATGMPPHLVDSILPKIPDLKRIDTAAGMIGDMLWFNPEYCWNFEIGSYFDLFENKLNASISLFYMDISDLQLTQFSLNGFGRMLSNAGSVTSKGFEFSLNSNPFSNFSILLNYGFADATFRNYKYTVQIFNPELDDTVNIEIDYSGKKVPYAPQHTVSVSGQYSQKINNFFIKNISLNLQYLGAGDIFWNEANDLSQSFYNVLNGKIIFDFPNFNFSNKISLELWANNITNTKYQVFYFETLSKKFFQMNKPFHFGASLKMEF